MGYSSGIHVWQLHCREDSLDGWQVGVATKEAQIYSGEPIGFDQESYGWRIYGNKCYHDFLRVTEWKFPEGLEGNTGPEDFKVIDKLYCILDMDEGYLAFATDEQYLGVAFRGLKGKVLYPMVSTYLNYTELTMKYLGGLNLTDKPSPCNCKGCTRLVISEYCKDCSDECVIDQEGTCRKDLSPTQPNLHGSQEDNLRRPHKLDILLQSNPPNNNIQERHAWNPTDRPSNISVKDDDKNTFCRNGDNNSIDRIRGKTGYSNGFHVWKLQSRNGSLRCLEVGVATEKSQLDSGKPNGFDRESYGWHPFLNKCYHDFPRFTEWKFPEGLEGITEEDFKVIDKLYCILDMDEGYLAFATDEQYLGVAFRGLKGKTLFPMVSSSIECEVTMKYIGGLNLWDEPSSCLCKGCPHLIIGWYCKECSAECEIDHEKKEEDEREEEEKLNGVEEGKEKNINEGEERRNEVELDEKENEDIIEEEEDEEEEKIVKKGCFRYPVKKMRKWLLK